MKHALVMLCLMSAPALAQDVNTLADSSWEVAHLMARPTLPSEGVVTGAVLQSRAEALPAAAVLPADTDSFAELNLKHLPWKHMEDAIDGHAAMYFRLFVESVAVGVSSQWVASMYAAEPMWSDAVARKVMIDLANVWQQRATQACGHQIARSLSTFLPVAQPSLSRPGAIYISAKLTPLGQEKLQSLPLPVNQDKKMTLDNGFEGYRLSEDYFLMMKRDGDKLMMVLATDPQQARMAASPAESVLAHASLDDARLQQPLILVSSTGKSLLQVLHVHALNPLQKVCHWLAETFDRMPPSVGQAPAAVASVKGLMDVVRELAPLPTMGRQAYIWSHGEGVLAEMVSDATGWYYEPAVMRLASVAGDPNVAFFMESAPLHRVLPLKGENAVQHVQTVAEAVSQTLHPLRQREWMSGIHLAHTCRGLLETISSTLAGKVGGSFAVTVCAPSSKSCCATWSTNILRKKALAQACEELWGNAHPCYELGKRVFVLGNDHAYNRFVAQSATGALPLPGAFLLFNPAPAAAACSFIAESEKDNRLKSFFAGAASALGKMAQKVDCVRSASVIFRSRRYTRLDVVFK